MRILQVVHYSDMGGIENYTRDLFAELEHRGHQVVVVATGHAVPGLARPGRSLHFLPELRGPSHVDHRLTTELDEVVRTEAPDVAHIHFCVNPLVARLMQRTMPIVWFVHNYGAFCPSGSRLFQRTDTICHLRHVPNPRCLLNAYTKRCNTAQPGRLGASYRNAKAARDALRSADAIVCDSEYVRCRYIEAGFAGERIGVLPSPVPTPSEADMNGSARESLVLFVGRITPEKGLDYLLRAVAMVSTPHHLMVVGNGYELERQRALAAELGLNGRVSFMGALDRPALYDLYRRAALVAVPSVWAEPFGMVGPEAMSVGTPVVAFRVGAIPEWLADGETGFLVDSQDVPGLAARIDLLLKDRALASRLGARGRQVMRERFTISEHVDRLERIFTSAIEARSTVVRSPRANERN